MEPQRNFLETYQEKHRNPVNRALHTVGIPMIVVSLGVAIWSWKVGLALFVFGWILQFLGHVFEGKLPAFFGNPLHLIVGPIWWAKKLFSPDRSGKPGASS